jgi:hypothetical protein
MKNEKSNQPTAADTLDVGRSPAIDPARLAQLERALDRIERVIAHVPAGEYRIISPFDRAGRWPVRKERIDS